LAVHRLRGPPPTHEGLSSRQVAGDPANVRAPDRDVEGSPATPNPFPQLHSSHNSIAWTHPAPHRVECRAGGTVVA
ncbi:MAG: hypothetical protein ACRDUV_08825, partial [Pseudonocardiaceae bacterium]